MERHQVKLVKQFAARVAPARIERRTDEQIVVLRKFPVGGFSVNLACGSDDYPPFKIGGGPEDVFGAVDVGDDRVYRIFYHQFNSDGGGEVNHPVGFSDKFAQPFRLFHYIKFEHPEVGITCCGTEVVPAAG